MMEIEIIKMVVLLNVRLNLAIIVSEIFVHHFLKKKIQKLFQLE